MPTTNFDTFLAKCKRQLKKQNIITNELLCYAYSTDASLYRIVPKLVILAEQEAEVVTILQLASRFDVKITFRAAGTSLSGQALGEEVLVVLKNGYWQDLDIYEEGKLISMGPGHIAGAINQCLRPFKHKIGPDPASINSCKIGGILANNSSGMCCGTEQNSYQTLETLRVILADGTILDSKDATSCQNFVRNKPNIIAKLKKLHAKINNDAELQAFIRKKFAIKNTSGYALNAFLDFTDPIDILIHLLIGSEGTLGFISSATLRTIPDPAYKAVNLVLARNAQDTANLAIILAQYKQAQKDENNISAIEILDNMSLNSVNNIPQLASYLYGIENNNCALLIEIQAQTSHLLNEQISQLHTLLDSSPLVKKHSNFTTDKEHYDLLWKTRKGILPSIAARRKGQTSVIIEDVAVPIAQLANLITSLQSLFHKYGYNDAAIFGHALAGNLHFVFTINFNLQNEVDNYARFMDEFCSLVITNYTGSLKAEHGSGRNLAPYALLEWGPKAHAILWQIKNLLDPQGILNPDVMLSKNNQVHIENLKTTPIVSKIIDGCMECGFCESVCPSQTLSLSPRQRIAVARHMTTITEPDIKRQWQNDYQYLGIASCATTGMCQTRCPVSINTGAYILEEIAKAPLARFNNPDIATNLRNSRIMINFANKSASILGKSTINHLTCKLHQLNHNFPVYRLSMPQTNQQTFVDSPPIALQNANNPVIWRLPSCPKRIFANPLIPNAEQKLLEQMGYTVKYPDNYADLCCGQAYNSKGHKATAHYYTGKLMAMATKLNQPIMIDNSSCAHFLKSSTESHQFIDMVQFVIDNLDTRRLNKRYGSLAVHIDCSRHKLGNYEAMLQLLSLCADKIIVPERIACCGFAGDKGFTIPELNMASLSQLRQHITGCEIGVSTNRNCLIGLSDVAKINYLDFSELILSCMN